jgi:hypothetical protein
MFIITINNPKEYNLIPWLVLDRGQTSTKGFNISCQYKQSRRYAPISNLYYSDVYELGSEPGILKFLFIYSHLTEAGPLNKSSSLAPALGLIKVIIVTDMILVTLCYAT